MTEKEYVEANKENIIKKFDLVYGNDKGQAVFDSLADDHLIKMVYFAHHIAKNVTIGYIEKNEKPKTIVKTKTKEVKKKIPRGHIF